MSDAPLVGTAEAALIAMMAGRDVAAPTVVL
jgi:hypothetical protein